MKQQLSSPSFADLLVGQRKVKQTFFSQIDKIIDWNPIRGIIEIAYTKGNKANVDGEARWVKKMGKLHFGYKRHSVTDENGLVLAEETTAANESDIKHLETPLKKANLLEKALVYADKGYDSAENKETLTRMKLKSRIMHKGTRSHKITERERRI
ncbi:MAG: transposase, partial [Prevotella sp.]|nr:transposase [Prevotella sp.]